MFFCILLLHAKDLDLTDYPCCDIQYKNYIFVLLLKGLQYNDHQEHESISFSFSFFKGERGNQIFDVDYKL